MADKCRKPNFAVLVQVLHMRDDNAEGKHLTSFMLKKAYPFWFTAYLFVGYGIVRLWYKDSQVWMPVFSFWIVRLVLPSYTEFLHLFPRRSAVIMFGHSRGLPFTRIPIAFSTYYCLSGSRIHSCRVKFNHTVWSHLLDKHRRYESFGFVRA